MKLMGFAKTLYTSYDSSALPGVPAIELSYFGSEPCQAISDINGGGSKSLDHVKTQTANSHYYIQERT